MKDESIKIVDNLGRILTAIRQNSDKELELISQMSDQIELIANKLSGVNSSLNYTNQHLSDVNKGLSDTLLTTSKIIASKSNSGETLTSDKSTPKHPDLSSKNPLNKSLNNTSEATTATAKTINSDSLITTDRLSEITSEAIPRTKPTFKPETINPNPTGPLTNKENSIGSSVADIAKATKQVLSATAKNIQQSEATNSLLEDYWRDEKGRLRHKSGRYASNDEAKAYETAEREQNGDKEKEKGLIARFFSFVNTNQQNSSHTEAGDAAGMAAGGSFFLAARDLYDLSVETKQAVGNVSLFDKKDAKNNDDNTKGNNADNRSNNNPDAVIANTSIQQSKVKAGSREKSDRKQELRNQSEQVETLKDQTVQQEKSYKKATSVLEEIERNTSPKGESLLSSLGSLKSLLGGGLGGLGGKGDGKGKVTGSTGSVSKDKPSKDKPSKDKPSKDKPSKDKPSKDKPKTTKTKNVDVAEPVTKKRIPSKSVLDTGIDSAGKKSSFLAKAGNLTKKVPIVGGLLTAASAYLGIKDRDDLSGSQKTVKAVATTGGAVAGGYGGALAGGAAGAAIGSVVPVVGTILGGAVGSILGAIGGSMIGEKTGDVVGDKIANAMSKDKTISDTLHTAWDDTIKDSESVLRDLFGTALSGSIANPDRYIPTTGYDNPTYKKGDKLDQQVSKYDNIIEEKSAKYNVDPNAIKMLIRQESGGKASAQSGVGAQGLMQLMPATAKELGVKNSFDPAQNIEGGTKYLAKHIDKYKGKGYDEQAALKLALASYNAGSGWVDAAINKSGDNSGNVEHVLGSLRDPSLSLRGKTRSAGNLKQTDDYVKKIYSNYAHVSNENNLGPVAASVPLRSDAMSAKTTAMTADIPNIRQLTENVGEIDTKNRNQPIPPAPVVVTNQPKPTAVQQTIKSNNSQNSTTSNTTNNVKNSSLVVNNTAIPTDFDDVSLRLQSWDRN